MASESTAGNQQHVDEIDASLIVVSNLEFLTVNQILDLPPEVKQKLTEWEKAVSNNVDKALSNKDEEMTRLRYQLKAVKDKVVAQREIEKTCIAKAAEAKTKAEKAIQEKDEVIVTISEKNAEIEKLTTSVESLSSQLQSSAFAGRDSIGSLTKLEMGILEKRLEFARHEPWTEKQIQQLSDELDKKDQEILSIQHENSKKIQELQKVLVEKNEEIQSSELALGNAQRVNEAYEKNIENLVSKQVNELEEMETKMQEKLLAQVKVAELSKETNDKASKKLKEQEELISSLQESLTEVSAKYEVLETREKNTSKTHRDAVTKLDDEIVRLRNELENTKMLIESYKENGLKELFQKMEVLNGQLAKEKATNQINVKRLEALQMRYEFESRDNQRYKNEAVNINKKFEASEKENWRLRDQVHDLSLQVQCLLREHETKHGEFYAVNHTVLEVKGSPRLQTPAQQLISNNMMVFTSIEELQLQNQKLLAVVRDLTERDENRSAQEELQIIEIDEHDQADVLQSGGKRVVDIQKQCKSLQTAYNSLQEEYATYKKERVAQEKVATEQTEKLRAELTKIRTEKEHISSQIELKEIYVKMYKENVDSFRKKIDELREINRRVGECNLKLDHNVDLLKSELSMNKQKTARRETALNSMIQERNALRNTVASRRHDNFEPNRILDRPQKVGNQQSASEDTRDDMKGIIIRLSERIQDVQSQVKILSNTKRKSEHSLPNDQSAVVAEKHRKLQLAATRMRSGFKKLRATRPAPKLSVPPNDSADLRQLSNGSISNVVPPALTQPSVLRVTPPTFKHWSRSGLFLPPQLVASKTERENENSVQSQSQPNPMITNKRSREINVEANHFQQDKEGKELDQPDSKRSRHIG